MRLIRVYNKSRNQFVRRSDEMIGRNDPCPCGSGKKYKACCLKKQTVVSMDAPVQEELMNILAKFYQLHPTPQEWKKIRDWIKEQHQGVFTNRSRSEAELIYSEAYLYIYERDIWLNYLQTAIHKAVRPRVKEILEQWKKPKYMLLRVQESSLHHIVAQNILTNEYVELSNDTIIGTVGSYIFGTFLKNSLDPEKQYLDISATVIPPFGDQQKAVRKIQALYEKSTTKDEDAFFYEHLFTCYELIETDGASEEAQFAVQEQQVLELLQETLIQLDVNYVDIVEVLKNYIEIEGLPKRMQKLGGLIAGAIQAGEILGFYTLSWTKQQLADYLEVSVSTANKYEKLLEQFYMQYMYNTRTPAFAIEYGTDPRASEFANWQMAKMAEDLEFTTEQDMYNALDELKNQSYRAKNKQEQAQIFAYESYAEQFSWKRQGLAQLAYSEDSQNVDALLLMAEQKTDDREQAKCYEQAIDNGKKQFDHSFERPWSYVKNRSYMRALFSYGIWHFERSYFDSALVYFERLLQLNTEDNQGARFFAIACYVKTGQHAKAKNILTRYRADQDALTTWLEWAWLKLSGAAEDKVTKTYERAVTLNAFVEKYMKEAIEPIHFPNHLVAQPKSQEEGKIIWLLLSPLVV